MTLKTRRISLYILLILLLVVFALPFKVESIHSTLYTTILGTSARATPAVIYHNAYQENFILGLQFFFYLSLVLLYFGRTRILAALAIISSILNALTLFVVYFGLTFYINFFGPKKTMEAGVGFYALCLLCTILIIFSVITWYSSPKKAWKTTNNQLIDSDF
jgi:hypothetical protein